MNTDIDFFDQRNYKISKFFASVIGTWPYHSKLRNRLIIFLFIVFFIVEGIPKVLALIVHANDSRVMLEAISNWAANVMSSVKFMNMIFREKKLKKLFERMKSDWNTLLNDQERSILESYADTGRVLATGYAASVLATTLMFVLEPAIPQLQTLLFNATKEPVKFAIPLEYIIIDKEKYYWILLSVSSTCIMGIVTCIVSSDVVFIVFLQHACGLFAVVGHRLENFEKNETYDERERESSASKRRDYEAEHAAKCIVSHHEALKFAEILEATYIWCFGIVVLASLPMLSVTAVQVMAPGNTVQELMKYAMYAGVQLLHLFFDCFLSQKLTDHSLNIQERIAYGRWYNNSIKSKKILVFITMRSQLPCYLTAGKVIILSIENYAKMVKTAASYFTVLVSTQ
ncbi:uncharacterized protein [Chelonus insularis]|uniref:uncharacterized protein n=1 Tax=Chelonus insularis TaxID=460826 RepID=UPI00158C7124|nr:uncharacterized protein LOC118066445 [Chelonus insularis]